MHRMSVKLLTLIVGTSLAGATLADDKLQQRIAHARSAAPPAISAEAAVMVDGKMVAKGSNGWTCMPDTMPSDGAAMCNDATWMKMMGAMGKKGDFEAKSVGISYMLKGDIGAGVSNSDPFHPDPKNAADYVETGPHLMIVVPRELLKGITDDPTQGGPYVMWGDTPYAHIMVPVASGN